MRRVLSFLASVLVMSLVVPLGADAQVPAGSARGTLTVGGAAVPLTHASLTLSDPLVTVHLSDVPLTTRQLDSFSELRESAAEGRVHLLRLWIHLRTREVTGIEVMDASIPAQNVNLYEGNLGDYDFTLLGPDRVEGTARTTGPLEGDLNGIAFDVAFNATPARFQARNPLDALVHWFPAFGRFLEALSRPLGWMADRIAWIFFGTVGLILVWVFVVIPRRQALFFRGLRQRGYGPLDPEDTVIQELLDSLLPVIPGIPLQTGPEARPRITRGVRRQVSGGFRIVARAWRNEILYRKSSRPRNELRFFTLVMESRPLPLDGDILIMGKDIGWPPVWLPHRDEALGVREISGGGSPAFSELYSVSAPGGRETAVPPRLQEALVNLADRLVARNLLQKNYLGVNLRFTPSGWGMIGDQQTTRSGMTRLVETADAISEALTGP